MNTLPHHRKNSTKKPIPGFAARKTAISLVAKIIDDQQTLDQLTDSASGFPHYLDLDKRDQALAKAIAATTLRHYRIIGRILAKIYDRKPPQRALSLIHALETAAAQILYMDVPDSAAVNTAISIIRADRRTERFAGFANAVLRKLEREKAALMEYAAGTHPFSDWLYKKLCTDHGKDKIAASGKMLQHWPYLDLQFKPGKNLPAKIKHADLPGGGARIIEEMPVRQISGYSEGDWWVQDIAASLAARLIPDTKGKQIADLCAAPGGKTLQLASLGANVISVDLSAKRLERLDENLRRTGLSATVVNTDILTWEPGREFDAVLLDAPCTATGTARRNPDVLWNRKQTDVDLLVELQKRLINKASELLKPGGTLIYANCSLLKDEGENLVAKLQNETLVLDKIKASELPGLEFCINGQGTIRCLPHYLEIEHKALKNNLNGMDGFFIARFIKL